MADAHDTGRINDDDDAAPPGPTDLEDPQYETPANEPNRNETLTLDATEITHEQWDSADFNTWQITQDFALKWAEHRRQLRDERQRNQARVEELEEQIAHLTESSREVGEAYDVLVSSLNETDQKINGSYRRA
jgi:chromosome segregation ATPase